MLFIDTRQLSLYVCTHRDTHMHLYTIYLTTWGLPYRDNCCPAFTLSYTLTFSLSAPENANEQEKGKKKLLWDREDASHCTINTTVKLCVAKAGSAATLSSFLTPYSFPSLPPPSLTPSPPTLFFPHSLSLFFISRQKGKWVTRRRCLQYFCAVMLNVWFAPFTTFPASVWSCIVV